MVNDLPRSSYQMAAACTADDFSDNPLFWIARDAMLIYDIRSRRVVLWNPVAVQLLGYTADEVIGVPLATFFPEEVREKTVELLMKYYVDVEPDAPLEDGAPVELQVVHKSGHRMVVEFTATPLDGPHRTCFLIIIRDCTERKRLDREREALLANAQEHARRVSELAALKADFTAMVAHELGNPVAAIGAMATLLERDGLPDEQRHHIQRSIQSEATMLQRLVGDMREASAFEREDFAVRPQPVPLTTLIADAVTSVQISSGEDAFHVETVPAVQVLADPERITQVLHNLLGNAFKHTPPGTPVELRTRQVDGAVRIDVADRGPGIHPDDLSRIFVKFGRGRNTSGDRVPGVGLGLYLSRRIMQAHGGDLRAESEHGKGTTFSFTLEEVHA